MPQADHRGARSRSDSAEHRTVEQEMIAALTKTWPRLKPAQAIRLSSGETICPDAVVVGRKFVLVEVYAHVGRLRGSQPDKLMADALKLVFLRTTKAYRGAKLVLAVCDDDVRTQITSGWRGEALRGLGVDVHTVTLTDKTLRRLKRQQTREDITKG